MPGKEKDFIGKLVVIREVRCSFGFALLYEDKEAELKSRQSEKGKNL